MQIIGLTVMFSVVPSVIIQVVQCSQSPSDPNRQAAHVLMMEMQQDAEMWCVEWIERIGCAWWTRGQIDGTRHDD